jgi:hypothetical protein
VLKFLTQHKEKQDADLCGLYAGRVEIVADTPIWQFSSDAEYDLVTKVLPNYFVMRKILMGAAAGSGVPPAEVEKILEKCVSWGAFLRAWALVLGDQQLEEPQQLMTLPRARARLGVRAKELAHRDAWGVCEETERTRKEQVRVGYREALAGTCATIAALATTRSGYSGKGQNVEASFSHFVLSCGDVAVSAYIQGGVPLRLECGAPRLAEALTGGTFKVRVLRKQITPKVFRESNGILLTGLRINQDFFTRDIFYDSKAAPFAFDLLKSPMHAMTVAAVVESADGVVVVGQHAVAEQQFVAMSVDFLDELYAQFYVACGIPAEPAASVFVPLRQFSESASHRNEQASDGPADIPDVSGCVTYHASPDFALVPPVAVLCCGLDG